jgi:ATP-dependent helicase/nuclease subunit B
LANAPEVVLTRALRRDGSPTLASRWLWRLKTLLGGARGEIARADAPLAWARALDAPAAPREAKIPRPKPPPDKRIKRLSVTRVETLIRDPYAFYAERILGLEVLKAIGAEAGPAERGIALHKAIERFEDGDEHGRLVELIDEELARAGVSAERRVAERERLQASVKALIDWFAERRARQPQVFRERKGELDLGGGVVLSGVADRIEIAPGHAAILDFKTGQPPSDKQVETGLSPQLLLEAAMLSRGAFADAPAAQASELIYFRFGNAEPAPRAVKLADGAAVAGERALKSLEGMLAKYAQAGQAFLSKPRVLKIRLYDDFDQLARRKEWADAGGEE